MTDLILGSSARHCMVIVKRKFLSSVGWILNLKKAGLKRLKVIGLCGSHSKPTKTRTKDVSMLLIIKITKSKS